MKAIWVVFDNGGKRVKEFAYPNGRRRDVPRREIERRRRAFYPSSSRTRSLGAAGESTRPAGGFRRFTSPPGRRLVGKIRKL